MFNLKSEFTPSGDQPTAIKKLTQGIEKNHQDQILLGITGSVKTFTIARDRSITASDRNLPPILSKLCMYQHFSINVQLKKIHFS